MYTLKCSFFFISLHTFNDISRFTIARCSLVVGRCSVHSDYYYIYSENEIEMLFGVWCLVGALFNENPYTSYNVTMCNV